MAKTERPAGFCGMDLGEWQNFLMDIPKFRKLAKEHPELGINAHNHTRASDGEVNILALILMNWLCGIREVWITDHNVIWDTTARKNTLLIIFCDFFLGMKIVAGAELSCRMDLSRYGGSRYAVMHMVVGNFKYSPGALRRRLVTFQMKRDARMEEIIAEIRKHGYEIPVYEELEKKYQNVTLKIIAQNVRYQEGERIDARYIEKNFLTSGAESYIPNDHLLSVAEAVAYGKAAGGEIILPHPEHSFKNGVFENHFEDIALALKREGVQKIEVRTKKQSRETARRIERFCLSNRLGISGGADTHFINDMRAYLRNMLEIYG